VRVIHLLKESHRARSCLMGWGSHGAWRMGSAWVRPSGFGSPGLMRIMCK